MFQSLFLQIFFFSILLPLLFFCDSNYIYVKFLYCSSSYCGSVLPIIPTSTFLFSFSFCIWISSCPTLFVGKSILSQSNCLVLLVKYQLLINVRVYFQTLSSLLLIYMSVTMPLSHCFHSCSITISSEIVKSKFSNFILI